MNRFTSGLKWLLIPALVTAALADGVLSNPTGSPAQPTTRTIIRTNFARQFDLGSNAWVFLPSNRIPVFNFETRQRFPSPGVYESAPYTCIVVVPAGHVDDRSLVAPAEVDPKMPVKKPDLQLIPRSPGQK